MFDEALQNALVRQAEITKAVVKMAADLAEVNAFIEGYYKMWSLRAPSSPGSAAAKNTQPFITQPTATHEVIRSVEVARELIGSSDKPLPVAVLFEAARAKGFEINTKKPNLTYSARLRDLKTQVGLIFLKGFGWWLKERPYPAAQYVPQASGSAGNHLN
jgi:hypothetical protein